MATTKRTPTANSYKCKEPINRPLPGLPSLTLKTTNSNRNKRNCHINNTCYTNYNTLNTAYGCQVLNNYNSKSCLNLTNKNMTNKRNKGRRVVSKYTHTAQLQSITKMTPNILNKNKASNDNRLHKRRSNTFGFGLRQSICSVLAARSDAPTHENCDVDDCDASDLSLSIAPGLLTGDDSYCAKKETLISPKYSASIIASNLRNIIAEKDAIIAEKNAIIGKLTQQIIVEKKRHTQSHSHSHSIVVKFQTEVAGLSNIVRDHFAFIDQQSLKVDKEIARLQSKVSLESAKEKSLKQEKDLLRGILSWSNMNIFLNDIILIENLLNSLYKPLQAKQSQARQRFAENISIYERKPKPICKVQSFVELLFAESLHIGPFKKWLKKVQNECKKQKIKIKHSSGAKVKSIERAFYKAFYVYSDDKMKGYEQMTDVLRCSLVFNNFRDIYQTFSIIEQLSTEHGGILRCKDRFNDANALFGYRDLSINIYCPSSDARIVCEIQLHHQLLYKHKDISHSMYTKARLFQQKDGNEAYKYAQKHLKTKNRNKIYQVASGTFDDEKQMVATNKHKFQSKAKEKLTEWGLEEYYDILVKQHGYDDIADWDGLSIDKLNKTMGFKQGHSERLVRNVQMCQEQPQEPILYRARR